MKYVELVRGRDYLGHGVKAYKETLLEVSDEKAEELVLSGFFRYSNIGNPDSGRMMGQKEKTEVSEKTPVFERMKTAELEAYAQEHEIDISGCRNNSERISLIKTVERTDTANEMLDFNG